MKIVTLGPSPYLLTSAGKIHSWVAKQFYSQGHQLAILAHSHDTSYYVPETTDNGHSMYCYQFDANKIPLFPYQKGGKAPNKTEAVVIYELLESLAPDLVITIDDYEACAFMQAVKMFLPDRFKWLWVLVNSVSPINEQSQSVVEYADGILCTNHFTCKNIKSFYAHPNLDWHYVGADLSVYKNLNQRKFDFLRLFCSAKNTFKDCPPAAIEACQKAKQKIDLRLYLHTNYHDPGFYNLDLLKSRHDPDETFLQFPQKYVSIKDGYKESEINELLNENHVFLSSSLLSASSISVFEALAAGCLPLINKQGSDAEIVNLIKEKKGEIDYFTYSSVKLLTAGEKYLNVPIIESMEWKIIEIEINPKD